MWTSKRMVDGVRRGDIVENARDRHLDGLLADARIAATTRMDHVLMHHYDRWAPRKRRIVPRFMLPSDRMGAFGSGGLRP